MKDRKCKGCDKSLKCRKQRCSTCQKKWRRTRDPEGYRAARAKQRKNKFNRGLCMRCNHKPRSSKYYCEDCLKINRQKQYNKHVTNRIEVVNYYGGHCDCCGESHILFLTIDHINGGGNQHRKLLRISAGAAFYSWLKRNSFPSGYRVLCWNCNITIGLYGSCPHQIGR